jgi:hypothetical protein
MDVKNEGMGGEATNTDFNTLRIKIAGKNLNGRDHFGDLSVDGVVKVKFSTCERLQTG